MTATLMLDMDGTLCDKPQGAHPTPGEYAKLKPHHEMLRWLRWALDVQNSEGYPLFRIILWTSRHEESRAATKQWLRRHKVDPDKLEIWMEKPFYDFIVDDKSVPIKTIEDDWRDDKIEAVKGNT